MLPGVIVGLPPISLLFLPGCWPWLRPTILTKTDSIRSIGYRRGRYPFDDTFRLEPNARSSPWLFFLAVLLFLPFFWMVKSCLSLSGLFVWQIYAASNKHLLKYAMLCSVPADSECISWVCFVAVGEFCCCSALPSSVKEKRQRSTFDRIWGIISLSRKATICLPFSCIVGLEALDDDIIFCTFFIVVSMFPECRGFTYAGQSKRPSRTISLMSRVDPYKVCTRVLRKDLTTCFRNLSFPDT